MKNVYKSLIIIFTFFAFSITSFAVCTNEETVQLNREAAGVKLTYEEGSEIITGDFGGSDGNYQATQMKVYYLNIIMSGLTDNVYVKLINTEDDSYKYYSIADATDGVVKIRWDNINEVHNFTFEVYSNEATNCPNEKIITNYFTLPMINIYADDAYCKSNYNEKICARYVTKTVSSKDYENFVNGIRTKVNEELKSKKSKNNNGIINFVKDNYIYFASGLLIVSILAIYIFVRIRKGSKL